MPTKNKKIIFPAVGIFMIVCGTILMLHRVLGERLQSGGSIQLVTGFTAVAVGAMLLTRSGISVFFYFCFVVAIALVQVPVAGFLSVDLGIVLLLLIVGILMIRSLPPQIRRR